jgi:hypothetical protein
LLGELGNTSRRQKKRAGREEAAISKPGKTPNRLERIGAEQTNPGKTSAGRALRLAEMSNAAALVRDGNAPAHADAPLINPSGWLCCRVKFMEKLNPRTLGKLILAARSLRAKTAWHHRANLTPRVLPTLTSCGFIGRMARHQSSAELLNHPHPARTGAVNVD